jgi:hypothetical protein
MSKENKMMRSALLMLGVVGLAGTVASCGGSSCAPARLQTSWTVTANGAPVSCAQAGATEVDFIIDSMEVPFPCSDLGDVSPAFAAGSRSVSLELRDGSQNVLSKLGPMPITFGCGETVDLGGVEFSLTP